MNTIWANKRFWLKLSLVSFILWFLLSCALFHFFSLIGLVWFFVIGSLMILIAFNAIPWLYESIS